jgi:hypothetical protein
VFRRARAEEGEAGIKLRLAHQIFAWFADPRAIGMLAAIAAAGSLIAIVIALKQHFAQADRWRIEDDRSGPRARLILDTHDSGEGWRHTVIDIRNRLNFDLAVESIESVRPRSMILAPQGSEGTLPDLSKKGRALYPRKGLVPSAATGDGWGSDVFVKKRRGTFKTGERITIRVNMYEVENPATRWVRVVTVAVAESAEPGVDS